MRWRLSFSTFSTIPIGAINAVPRISWLSLCYINRKRARIQGRSIMELAKPIPRKRWPLRFLGVTAGLFSFGDSQSTLTVSGPTLGLVQFISTLALQQVSSRQLSFFYSWRWPVSEG